MLIYCCIISAVGVSTENDHTLVDTLYPAFHFSLVLIVKCIIYLIHK